MVDEINAFIGKKAAVPETASTEEEREFHFEVTQLAADKIKYLAEQQGKKGYGLRIQVVRGGCSGYMYNMDFEKAKNDDDVIVEQHDVRLFVDKESAKMLNDVTVDYIESLQGAGFKISNPNETASCGCGKSFK
ncbi:MAG: iron-sulfur cluster assembly accessory protein [Planctomycetes bacterium]|nr:iron-sulfur cluster assembly accessory protein [Planctomycetota bacterium]